MKPRTTIILAVVALILVAIALLSQRTERAHETLASGPIFPGMSTETVASIRISNAQKSVELTRRDDLWRVTSDGDYPADPQMLQRLVDTFAQFDRKHLRSRNPEMQGSFDVADTSGVEVLLADAGGQTLAHFRMGKNGPDHSSQFIRPTGAEEVYLIPAYLKSHFDPNRPSWRDKAILTFAADKVKELELHAADGGTILLVKQTAGGFAMAQPESAAVKQGLVDSAVRTLSTLRTDTFVDSLPLLADVGLAPPAQRAIVRLEDGATHEVWFGTENESQRHYVKRPDNEMLFLVNKSRLTSIFRTAEELKEAAAIPAEGE